LAESVLWRFLVSKIPQLKLSPYLLFNVGLFFRELPRVLTIYDIEMPLPEAKQAVRGYFLDNAYVRDPRVVEMVIEKGYMELEETLLHYKQRPHLIKILHAHETPVAGPNRKRLTLDASIEEQFNRA
jgi:NADH dehydrogenase (ubiquinone) 1 alpha subcomplex subunit 6